MVILFSRDSCDFLFISQFILLTLSSNCLLLAFICVCHDSFWSRWSPRYLTEFVSWKWINVRLQNVRKLSQATAVKFGCPRLRSTHTAHQNCSVECAWGRKERLMDSACRLFVGFCAAALSFSGVAWSSDAAIITRRDGATKLYIILTRLRMRRGSRLGREGEKERMRCGD
jgi:hypothetical protein